MSEEQTVLDGRVATEARMIDTCRIERVSDQQVFDRATLSYTAGPPTVKYAGKCWVKAEALVPGTAETGDQTDTLLTYTVAVPIEVVDVAEDDVVVITAVGRGSDPGLVGLRVAVHTVLRKTRLTARRLTCQEVAGWTASN